MKLDRPDKAVFVIANDIIVLVYTAKKNVVMTPFPISSITELNYADNVPSACTITVDESVEDKIGRSHIILESKSMGLILRYILEREYEIEVDFCNTVIIRERGVERTFSFTELEQARQERVDEKNNGTLRATITS